MTTGYEQTNQVLENGQLGMLPSAKILTLDAGNMARRNGPCTRSPETACLMNCTNCSPALHFTGARHQGQYCCCVRCFMVLHTTLERTRWNALLTARRLQWPEGPAHVIPTTQLATPLQTSLHPANAACQP